MKYYIASSFANIQAVREVAGKLNRHGWVQTYDWTQKNRAETLVELRRIGEDEKRSVMDCDFLIVLTPAGKGSHIEFGIALGLGIPVYLYSNGTDILDLETTSTFYHVHGVKTFVGELSTFIDDVVSEVKANLLKK
ncbi:MULTISPECIES: group-specific protein [unclassified Bacillus (in: firmicutes)]|uniref:group-specific protein n=1 Tax=unclassified Bacillus (in: firmicutes) TaxID=185979 RepID=UPI0008E81E0B|nr:MULTISPECIES: group-specific protein [unclassified Bacillus (in: firmicutes)]SFA85726.1 hypothetical protein SAMN02799634_10253 [Bacillus sp. UNCCL13]SFQ83510.1 hypothetical protein SAMN04488577_2172 [Bacillus sp. cl95]